MFYEQLLHIQWPAQSKRHPCRGDNTTSVKTNMENKKGGFDPEGVTDIRVMRHRVAHVDQFLIEIIVVLVHN